MAGGGEHWIADKVCCNFSLNGILSAITEVLIFLLLSRRTMPPAIMEAPGDVANFARRIGGPGKPLCKVGLVSDIQYANIDDRFSFSGRLRYYRNTVVQLKLAAKYWNEEKVDLVLHCGDVIDGANRDNGTVDEAINTVIDSLKGIQAPIHHVLGNHCVYCLSREQLRTVLKMQTPCSEVGYYSISPYPSWKFMMLDSSDIAMFGRADDHPNTQLARMTLDAENPNENKSSNDGIHGPSKRFVAFGGGISRTQKDWILSELLEARKRNQNVVVSCHIPLIEGLYTNTCLVWNYEEIRELLNEFPNVKLALYGHTHQMSYLRDATGLHHLVVPGLVEAVPGERGFGSLNIYDDRLEVVGFGDDPLILPL